MRNADRGPGPWLFFYPQWTRRRAAWSPELALRVGGRPVLQACLKGGGALLSQVDIGPKWCDQNAYPCELARFLGLSGDMPDRVNTDLWSLQLYFSILVLPIGRKFVSFRSGFCAVGVKF